jgi:hypothetical protein
MEGGDPTDITQFTSAVEKSGFRIDPKTGNLQKKGSTINPFSSGFSDIDPTEDVDAMKRVEALRVANKKLFNQYFGSQFGTTTTAAPSADGSANFGFEDFSFEELD